jgi:hypothetical protein
LILDQKDLKWKQRAKQTWYTKRDRNTPYFSLLGKSKKRKTNIISCIRDDACEEWLQMHEVRGAFVKYFQKMYTSRGSKGMDDCLEGMEFRVNFDMNNILLAIYTRT